MTYRMAFLSAAALCAAALPQAAAAADYYDEGRGAPVFHQGPGEGDFDEDRVPLAPGRGVHPADRRFPGPVVYDDRDPGRHGWPPRRPYGEPIPLERPPFGEAPRFAGPAYGWPARPLPGYRAIGAPGEAYALDPRAGRPDAGCTMEQAESITPAGWRKIVTHRTCYRR